MKLFNVKFPQEQVPYVDLVRFDRFMHQSFVAMSP